MWIKFILISFFLAGISDTTWKMAGETCGASVNSYLLLFHVFALLSATFAVIKTRTRIKKTEFLLGSIIGFALISGGIASMQAILRIPGIIYFPVASCGNLLIVTIMANILWKEKPTNRQIAGLVIACISIVLIVL